MVYVSYTTTPRSEWRRGTPQAKRIGYRLRFGYRHLGAATLALAIGGAGFYAVTNPGGSSQDHLGGESAVASSSAADAAGRGRTEPALGTAYQAPVAEPKTVPRQPLLLSLNTFDFAPGKLSGVSLPNDSSSAPSHAEAPMKPAKAALSPPTSKAHSRPVDPPPVANRPPTAGSLDDGQAPDGTQNFASAFGTADTRSPSAGRVAEWENPAEAGGMASPSSSGEMAGTTDALAPPSGATAQSSGRAAPTLELTVPYMPDPAPELTARPGRLESPEPAAQNVASTAARSEITDSISAPAENRIEPSADDRPALSGDLEGEHRALAANAFPERAARVESPARMANAGAITRASAGAPGPNAETPAFSQSFPMIEVAGDKLGAITMRDFGANRQAVHLGTLLSLFRLKMHPAEFARLSASPAAAQYITLEALGQAGFAVDYDARRGILHLDAGR